MPSSHVADMIVLASKELIDDINQRKIIGIKNPYIRHKNDVPVAKLRMAKPGYSQAGYVEHLITKNL